MATRSSTKSAVSQDGQRDANGRFMRGNAGGKGNPHAKRVNDFRSAIIEAVTPEYIQAVIRAMIKAAIEGDVAAAKLVLERTVGSVKQEIQIEAGDLRVVECIVRTRDDRPAPDAG